MGDIPNLNFSYTNNLASSVNRQIEESNRRNMEMVEEASRNRQRIQDAIEETAKNTGETNLQLTKVIENQNEYIDILKRQLESNEQQLGILRDIFSTDQDCSEIEKELLKLLQEQIDSQHPLWDYVKDKGGDVAVAGVTAGIPVLYNMLKGFLMSKGIMLP